MEKIVHKITQSEITYGIIVLKKRDGSKNFFESMPLKFTLTLNGVDIPHRKISAGKIWVGYTYMAKFKPGDKIKVGAKDGRLVFEKK